MSETVERGPIARVLDIPARTGTTITRVTHHGTTVPQPALGGVVLEFLIWLIT
jgi:hypothetical protein